MDPISIAMALAQFAPSLMRFFKAGEAPVALVEKVLDIATATTGAENPAQALEMLKLNSQHQAAFNTAVLVSNTELENAYLEDVKDARRRDIAFISVGNHNYRADTMYVLAVIVIGILCYAVFTSDMDEYAKGIVTLVLGRFLGYLDNIYNFEFGTTRVSREKDRSITNLTERR